MSWGTKHQLIILGILIMLLLGFGIVLSLPYVLKAPTCADGKQDGNETGVDCGGSCAKFCPADVNDLKLLWARPFKVTEGIYDVLAYLDNQNYSAGSKKIVYKFRLYDDKNLYIGERVGKTYVTPNGRIAIFEGGISTGTRVPKRVFFEIATAPEWIRVPADSTSFILSKGTPALEAIGEKPRLLVPITNNSAYNAKDVEITAILYDSSDNAFAVSRTSIDSLPKGQSQNAVFTWLIPFQEAPARIEIIPRADIFSMSF